MKLIGPTSLFFLISLWASSAAALIINPVITGADMAGIEVTAFFNATSDSALWNVTSTDPGVPLGEGFAGEANGTDWVLSQQGYTLGNYDSTYGVLGAWTLTNNTGFNITRLQINALIANIAFDAWFDSEVTPGSDIGRAFLPDPGYTEPTSATYSNQLNPGYNDLFGSLTIDFENGGLAHGASMQFLADTDAIPTPGSLWLFTVGLLGIGFRRFWCKTGVTRNNLQYRRIML